jgi:hypothetical protein
MRFLRFDYTTGDAAGENIVTKATHAACAWMIGQGLDGLEHVTLSANLDTEKEDSALNNLQTRGKARGGRLWGRARTRRGCWWRQSNDGVGARFEVEPPGAIALVAAVHRQ